MRPTRRSGSNAAQASLGWIVGPRGAAPIKRDAEVTYRITQLHLS
jgi:hypothetical protein